jgi:hypothetical protein
VIELAGDDEGRHVVARRPEERRVDRRGGPDRAGCALLLDPVGAEEGAGARRADRRRVDPGGALGADVRQVEPVGREAVGADRVEQRGEVARGGAIEEEGQPALAGARGHQAAHRLGQGAAGDRPAATGVLDLDRPGVEAVEQRGPPLLERRVGRGAGRLGAAGGEQEPEGALGPGGVVQRRLQVERRRADQDRPPHPAAVAAHVRLGQLGAVRQGEHIDLPVTERGAHPVEIVGRKLGAVAGQVGARREVVAAGGDQVEGVHRLERVAALEPGTAQPVRPTGAALIDQDDVAVLAIGLAVGQVEVGPRGG